MTALNLSLSDAPLQSSALEVLQQLRVPVSPDGIPGIVADLDRFAELFRAQWLQENKMFGLETLELRFGGQRGRLVSTEQILRLYLSGRLTRIEPLEIPLLYPNGKDADEPDREINKYAEYCYGNTLPAGVPHC